MAHNFKRIIEGAYYVSKSGHDSNDGLSPDRPLRTISQALIPSNSVVVIGAGHYTEGYLPTNNQYRWMYGDGKVILDSFVSGGFSANYVNGNSYDTNIEFRNMLIACRAGVIENIIAKNCQLAGYVTSSNVSKSVIIDSDFQLAGDDFINPNYSVLIRCTGVVSNINSCYVDKLSEFTMLYDRVNIRHSNFRGVFVMRGAIFSDGVAKKYAVQDQLTGTPQDNSYPAGVKWFSYDQVMADGYIGTATNLNNSVGDIATCMNRDPLFNNEALEDFTLQAGSPHINTAQDSSNIGGTDLAISVINTDHNGSNIKIIPSPQIDTSVPDSYKLKAGEIDGYIDYIIKIGNKDLILEEISPISLMNFNSDEPEGSAGNNNVPDSEPLTIDYPRKLTTTSLSADASTLNVTGHDVIVGEWVRVLGESRKVIAVTANTITVENPLRAAVDSGIEFRAAALINLSATNPNRLTYLMRTSKQNEEPTVDSDWDNHIDPIYGMAGAFLTQEWDKKPGYVVDILNGNAVYGSGDSEAPHDQPVNYISCQWINIRAYIRNNYDS